LIFCIFSSSTFAVVSPTSEYGNGSNDSLLQPDFGLFEASHLACPVLPQYHPKQLMELLNSGKIRWVKAILAHLVRVFNRPSHFKLFHLYMYPIKN
jgi:hypothetical protein